MKPVKIIILMQFVLANVFAQFPHQDSSYFFLFGNDNTEEFRDGCNHSLDSGYVMVGSTSSFSGDGSDIYIVKTDWKGKTLWSRTIGGPGVENGFSIKETPDHGFILGGFTNSNINHDYNMLLIKTDSEGFVQWQKTYGGADWDFLYSVALTPDSGFVLCGETYSFGNLSSDIYLIRTDKNGDTIWTKNYGGPGKDAANKIITTSDGNIVAVGYSESNSVGQKDLFLLKCNLSSGDSIYSKKFGGQFNDEARSVVEHTALDSGYVLVGYTESFTSAHDKDLLLLKFNKDGSLMWQDHFGNNGGNDEATCIYSQGINFFVSGYTANGAGVCDLAAGVVDLFGNWQWNQSTSYGSYEADIAWSNFKSLRDHFVFVGSTQSFGSIDQDAMIIVVDTIQFQFQNVHTSSDSLVGVMETVTSEYSFFPNPANEFLLLNFKRPIGSGSAIKVFDFSGKMVLSNDLTVGENIFYLDISNLSAGIYEVSFFLAGKIFNHKLSIVH